MPTDPIAHWDDALAFAVERHGRQVRKGTRVPYVTHVVAVAETLAYHYPERDALVIAGLLHDVVEDDEATTVEDVATRFGDAVATLVAAVSKDDEAMRAAVGPALDALLDGASKDEARRILWWERRRFMLRHLDASSYDPETRRDVLRLKAADAHANLGSILRDLRNPAVGAGLWSRFKVGRADSLWFYDRITEAVAEGLAGEPLATELDAVLRAVRAT